MADLHDDFENEKDLGQSFEQEKGPAPTSADLLKDGYSFQKFQQLSPEEQEKYHEALHRQAGENAEAFGRGAAKGATLGFQEKLSAPVERMMAETFGDEGTKELYAGKSDKDLEDTYKQQNATARENAPVAYTMGQIAGGTPAAIAAGGAGSALGAGIEGATGLGNIAAQTVGQTAAGATLGATQGLGNSAGSLTGSDEEQAQALKDMGTGATIGGAVPLALGGVAAGAQALSGPGAQEAANAAAQPIQEMANTQAVKSLQPSASQLAKMNLKGTTQQVGQKLLDENLVPTMSTAAGRAEGIQKFTQAAGEAQVPAAQAIDQQAASLISKQSPEVQAQVKKLLDPQSLVDHLQEEIMDPLRASGDPANTAIKVQELLDKIPQMADQTGGQMSFNGLNMFRQRLDKMINYETPRGSDLQSTLKQFRSVLDDSLADTANQIDSLSGTKLSDAFAKTKADYSSGIKATNLSAAQEAKSSATPFTTLQAAKQVIKNPAINRFVANTANTVAGIVRQAPETFGQYAQPLQQALTRGPEAFSAMLFTLQQQDPEFRTKYNAVLDSQPNQSNGSSKATNGY